MPPRKRSTTQNERRRKVRRTDNNDEDTLVISDSENEEEEEEVINVTPRATRWMKREKKAQMQDMTEDEMLDLAMRLSKQEASSATQRKQLEDADMRKAIAESLSVNHGQASATRTQDRPSSLVKPHQESDTVSVQLKRKLSFPNVGSRHSESGDGTAAAVSNVERKQQLSPLPPMPDLSQKSSSQPSPPSPVLPSVPSAASRQSQSSRRKDLGEQGLNADSSEDEPSQSTSQLQTSPAFRRCSLRLNQDSPSTSKASTTLPRTYDCSVRLTCPGKSQFTQLQSPSPPQSPVFAETDPKGMSEARFSHCTSCGSFKKDVCTPHETFQGASSHKSSVHECRDPQNRVSLSGKAQPSSSVSVPEDAGLKQEPVKLTERKDEAQGTTKGSAQRSESLLPADTKSLDEYTSYMVLHMSDDDGDDDDEEVKVFAPSPVFAQECVSPAGQRKLSPTQPCCSPLMNISTTHTPSHTKTDSVQQRPDVFRMSGVPEAATGDSRLRDPLKARGEGLVSYYWGVPFCPKGQSPDEYTRVILTQLEVYEKSLKDAQRQLLHKAEWGLPVGPCPTERPFGKRLKRHRAPQLQEEEEEDEERGEEEKEGGRKVEEKEESQPCTEEGAENGQSETYVVVSSPEPQEELVQKFPLLLGQREAVDSAKPSSCRKPIAQDLPEDLEVQQPDEQKEEVQNGSFDLGSTVCPETQMTEDDTPELMVTAQPQAWEETEVMEVDEAGEPPAEAEEKMEQEPSEQEEQWMEAGPPQSQSEMECPICSHLFPLSKIELHAAYCNGTVEEQPPQENVSQGSAPRTRTKKVVMEEALSEKSVQREKCYLCCKFIPGKEYPKHVEQCLQKTAKGANQGNGLLSALNQTKQVHLDDDRPGPSDVVTKNSRGLADPSMMAETGESTDSQELTYHVSTSPIKSFTPISEVTDCLVDFSKQYSNRANQRLGRKRKFKR